ncbi:zinc-dependent metalloprotease family protein [Polaribacter sp. Z022]|uniref:reprolysin-like metallopeptidase n=1 Tax=Polaribacter sp. Z022 TaxID=2927125 RepID=UPI0020228650|nr:zinc-dependent metalloprotease family protein [Polaribacter sp. Z022]MCL7754499.1 M12 family metallo-peptidase [Polaribacter sp. Z022]
MKTKLPLILIFIAVFFFVERVSAQDFLMKLDKSTVAFQENEIHKKKNFPKQYQLVSVDEKKLSSFVNSKAKTEKRTIKLPNTKGGFSNFIIKETSNFDATLSEKYPSIKSFSAQGIDDPSAVAKISIGLDGFHAVVYSGVEETLYIDPYTKNNKSLIVYKRKNLDVNKDDFTCQVEELSKMGVSQNNLMRNANDGVLRVFRLALVCSGEYAQFHLTNQGVSTLATDAVKKAAVLSAMNTTMTRVNGIFERDLSVKMVIVGNNDKVVFLDAATDNITDGDPDAMIDEVQSICDTQIGDANYDIGHVFSIGGDGLAGGGVVCLTGQKARGVTGRSQPIGDAYDIDFVVHELGHQFGANHTQNNSCNRNNATAVEPGSASTIMGYAGICSPNVQGQSDDYFHAISIAEMWNTIQSSASCATLVNTNNNAPTANAGANYSIPKSTPFVLKGVATDADGMSSLTYNWEQTDNEIATMSPISTNSGGPMFRSLPSKTTPNRYMPDLTTVLSGSTSTTWEVLPSVARDLNFAFTVRDNHSGGGSTARDNMKVTVVDAVPFTVSTPSTSVSWDVGSTQTISWSKGTSDIAPIGCQLVNIKLSTDGGLTFPITIKANTPNDGSENIVVPNNVSSSARIMVEAADNIFYNVNSTNFTINSTVPTFVISNTSGTQSACNTGNETASYVLDLDFVNSFSEDVTFTTSGQPSGSTVTFNPTTINADGTVTMQVSNLNGATAQAYTISVNGNSTSVNQSIDVQLNVTNSSFNILNLTSPANNLTGVKINTELKWNSDINASSYDVQVSKNAAFTSLISNSNVTTNYFSLTSLEGNTTYYWRVKPKNSCGEGSFTSPFNFTTLTPSYCASTFTDEIGGTEHITNVTFNTINNTSGNDLVDGYQDFTSEETNVKRGDTYQISVTLDTGGYQDHVFVFIDWNQDFEFDKDTERYDLGTLLDDVGTKSFSITVPNDAAFGSTTMRVVIEYDDPTDGYGDGPCDSDHLTEWGETEDYTVIVDNTASIDNAIFEGFSLYPNPTNGEFTLNLKLINSEKVSVQLLDVRGRLIDEKNFKDSVTNFSEKIFFEKAISGLYLLKVTNGNKQIVKKLIIK